MTSAFETLGKILKLEREQGYKNKAVIRGLEALVKTWPVEAVKEAPATTPVVEQIASLLQGYGSLPDRPAREARVAQITEKLTACQEIIAAPTPNGPRHRRRYRHKSVLPPGQSHRPRLPLEKSPPVWGSARR